jgi:hypothetical protein
VWGMIDAEPIVFPLVIDEFNSAMLLFSVPATAARSLLPGDAFEIVEFEPGSAQLVLAACDFRRNPWGDYDEVDVGLMVRPVGAPVDVTGVLMHRTLVNQRFTYEAARRALTFPGAVDDIDVRYAGDEVTFELAVDGVRAVSLHVPRVAPEAAPERVDQLAYSYVGGVAHCVHLEVDVPRGVVDPAAVRIELGAGPVAAELRRLGLPRAPDFCTWGEGLTARFHAPEPL